MAKPKATPKPKKKVSKNHFKAGDPDGVAAVVGSFRGVSVEMYQVQEEAADIKLVGEKQTSGHGGGNKVTIEGDELRVFTTDKAVFFVPPCGDAGIAITRETLDAVVEAVRASK